MAICCGGELELTSGAMGKHLTSRGIVIQKTVPYAHAQNGKSERYIRTLEEGGQALLADSGLPMSFWLDAVLTRQYLTNRLPTSTLPDNITPFEAFTNGKKPDLSHLRVWGCDCYVAIPDELCPKAGFKRFRAIFVGYEEHRVGWRVRSIAGKYSFSNNVIFNENLSGRLGVPRPLPPSTIDNTRSSSPCLAHDQPHVRTAAGQAFDEVICLKEFHKAARDERKRVLGLAVEMSGESVGAVAAIGVHGGVDVISHKNCDVVADFSPSLDAVDAFISQIALSSLSDHVESISHVPIETDILGDQARLALSTQATPSQSFNLSKAPFSFSEAVSWTDAPVWCAAMKRELESLDEMGAFEETDLPTGGRAIGLKWVFAHKTDADGAIITGKEKARLVAQGFNQHPGQYDETYAPVAKMASVRILLAWAAVRDLDIYQFDCKTAFLHAKIRHPVYGRQIPGFPLSDPKRVLRIQVALYGLRQSAYEFYTLFLSLLLDLGMVRCEVDHGVFIGEWSSPPDSSVATMDDGSPLVLYVPLHVDDGLAITNSLSLYKWFLTILSKRLLIVDLGPSSAFSLSVIDLTAVFGSHHIYMLRTY